MFLSNRDARTLEILPTEIPAFALAFSQADASPKIVIFLWRPINIYEIAFAA